ncbi:MAG: GNAT family N-acetyltransferase [Saprospiraceae bacterium]|jgi:hypothetical protein|nr:GNAT family N-acetyltransferase [Saprospiraceae bacterium]
MEPNTASGYQTQLLERGQIEDAVWNEFIARSPQAAPYGCTWYLDVVWPGWGAIVVTEKGTMLAAMPIKVSKKYGIQYVFNPPFCQYVGIFFGEIAKKNATLSYSLKKRLVKAIVEAIPKEIKVFNIKFAPEFDYPLPFHWAGYELQTRYSYWLDNQIDKSVILSNFAQSTRNYINKAIKNGLAAQWTENIEPIVGLATQRKTYLFNETLLKNLWETKKCRALEVRSIDGTLHAGLIYLEFQHKIIVLFSAFDAKLGQFGGMSLAIWKAIEAAGPAVNFIDFEGSMLEPIEGFFRNFGSHPVPYLQIKKNTFPKPLRWVFE